MFANKATWNSPDTEKDPAWAPPSLGEGQGRHGRAVEPRARSGAPFCPPPPATRGRPGRAARDTLARSLASPANGRDMAGLKRLSSWPRLCASARGPGGPWTKVALAEGSLVSPRIRARRAASRDGALAGDPAGSARGGQGGMGDGGRVTAAGGRCAPAPRSASRGRTGAPREAQNPGPS